MNPIRKKGGISVQTEHIFPIIKKWLYSEKDIFLREIVSNASDAVTKLRRLESLGQYDSKGESYRIDITVDPEAKTLTVSDNGIGMTEEELDRYICQIALSGAVDFIQKYEGENQSSGIIGHFGLGFYSSFMVSDTVEVITKSYTDAPAVHWTCSSDGNYETKSGERDQHGTTVIMHISEEEGDFLRSYILRDILNKYCAFMPVEVYFKEIGKEDGNEEPSLPVNETHPLWLKAPSECTPDDYKKFYREMFHDPADPLFWIHINADYPLNFKGILFFPRPDADFKPVETKIKLFYNQVYVADDIKEVIPDYLLMLKGVLDCPELPLNVSRSYLQNSVYIKKVGAHIVKKVADKLNSLFNTEREQYEADWKDIRVFTQVACMNDRKFFDRVKDALLLELPNGTHTPLSEFLEKCKETQNNALYYTTDKSMQAQYVSMLESRGIHVAVLDQPAEMQFATVLETYIDGLKCYRVDSNITELLRGDGEAVENEDLKDLFKRISGEKELTVEFAALKEETVPLLITVSEESKRIEEMMRYMTAQNPFFAGNLPNPITLTVNTNAPLIQKLQQFEGEKKEKLATHLYQLALLTQRKLTAEELSSFLAASYDVLNML